ncbi:hypothetical protein [Limosilactobacillus ingluviei]|uniref:hypothetical protein n=1 Tax=Limosilactobacillus ingluviei TaxID=148604 RepID=UPI0023F0457E|nr:hypothetical protein [Limosilactobacillus ingluviei]
MRSDELKITHQSVTDFFAEINTDALTERLKLSVNEQLQNPTVYGEFEAESTRLESAIALSKTRKELAQRQEIPSVPRDKTLSEALPLQNTYDFLDTPAAIKAKEEAELGQTHLIGDLADFNEWIDTIDSASTPSIHS